MLFNKTSFIGVDPSAGGRPFVYAALDSELSLLALGEGEMEDVLAFVGGQQGAFVAVCAPRQPNQGLMAKPEIRERCSPPPRPGRWQGFRVAEYELRMHNIHVHPTPTRERSCARWIQMGFEIFRRLARMDFEVYPEEGASFQSLEVYPHAAYSVLLELIPFPKQSLEGKLQRQLVLYSNQVGVPNPMRFFEEITSHRLLQGILPEGILFTANELDALVAAYTAWVAALQPENISLVGNPGEGQIVLPTPQLKSRY